MVSSFFPSFFLGVPPRPPASLRSRWQIKRAGYPERSETGGLGGTPRQKRWADVTNRYVGVAGTSGEGIGPNGTYNDSSSGRFNASFPGTCPYMTSMGATQVPTGTKVLLSLATGDAARDGVRDGATRGPSNSTTFNFLQKQMATAGANDTVTARICIPSPTMAHFGGSGENIDVTAYPTLEPFLNGVVHVYQTELDDSKLAYLCDEGIRRVAEERYGSASTPMEQYVDTNASMAKRPKDMTMDIHLCRSNYRSS